MRLRRLSGAAGATGLLVLAALPFVALFPDPPAFGPEAVMLLTVIAAVATGATAWRADEAGRRRVLRRSAAVFAVTVAATATNMLLHGGVPLVPTPDVLPGLFGLGGEDVDAAILFEAWCELWLFWAIVVGLLAPRLLPRPPAPGPWDVPRQRQPWNGATLLLWAVGWGAVAGTVAEGHRAAAFLARAARAGGVIADGDSHPLIRFTAADGTVVVFRQNGGISRAVGAAVPVAYDTADPGGTAQADTVFVNWGDTAGLAWLGLGFTLFPFFGARAAFGRR